MITWVDVLLSQHLAVQPSTSYVSLLSLSFLNKKKIKIKTVGPQSVAHCYNAGKAYCLHGLSCTHAIIALLGGKQVPEEVSVFVYFTATPLS